MIRKLDIMKIYLSLQYERVIANTNQNKYDT